MQRPTRPTSNDAAAVVREAGFSPTVEDWTPDELWMSSDDVGHLVASMRRYLCLPADRDADIAHVLEPRLMRRDGLGGLAPRQMAAIWWDASEPSG